ncbi:hypothetical protein [Synechococcus sp. RSCCF101]|uniref:hypothetical protein n=1 Tax=Synechococcus sp. RSCCF101 TaxID=2511069 RepID=UPI001CD9F0E4|nr:hypothetical protein [Synechococcus sp. RSCCF101]
MSLVAALVQAGAAVAQVDSEAVFARARAVNLARMHAERLNGGLSGYRAAACMHRTGSTDCLIGEDGEGYTFRFRGGPPGWEQEVPPVPTVESVVTIALDGRSVVAVPYNGPLVPDDEPAAAGDS